VGLAAERRSEFSGPNPERVRVRWNEVLGLESELHFTEAP